jgi:hypothetical protein
MDAGYLPVTILVHWGACWLAFGHCDPDSTRSLAINTDGPECFRNRDRWSMICLRVSCRTEH